MIGIHFPKDDKARLDTQPLGIESKNLFKTTDELINFVYGTDYNTFFASDVDISSLEGKIKKFKQGSDKEKYITQDDVADEFASCIILDIDRHEMVNPTMADPHEALRELSKEFKNILYVPSKTTSEVFKGRLFIPLNKRTNKQIFRKYFECWLKEKFGTGYVINHHMRNAAYFETGEDIEDTSVSHEFVDRVSFNPSHKMNIYNSTKNGIQFWREGSLLWEPQNTQEIPALEINPLDISRKLRKYGKANEIKMPGLYWHESSFPITDKLSPAEKEEVIQKALIRAKSVLKTDGLSRREIVVQYRKEMRDGEIMGHQCLRRNDGLVDTVENLLQKGVEGNFAYEPNHRKERGYIQIKNGRVIDYQGGQVTRLVVRRATEFEQNEETIEYDGQYLPEEYGENRNKIDFVVAPTGSGKSYSFRDQGKTIFLVPTKAIAANLEAGGGFVYVASTQDRKAPIKRLVDIPKERLGETIVMTYDKFAWLNLTADFSDFTIVVDEAPLIMSKKHDEYTKNRDEFLKMVFNGVFKYVRFISANPYFYEMFSWFIHNGSVEWSEVSVRNFVPTRGKDITFEAVEGFTEGELQALKSQRTIVYCNDKNKGRQWAERIGGELIEAGGSVSVDAIDENPTKNYVFTAVMREGYSFKSEVDNMIIDSRTPVVCGVNTVIQAASRARNKAKKYYLISSLDRKPYTEDMARYCEVNTYVELAMIFHEADGYINEEIPVVKNLPLYRHIKQAIDTKGRDLGVVSLVGCCIEEIERLEQQDIDFMQKNLERAGYGLKVCPVEGEVVKFKRSDKKREKLTHDEIKLNNGKKAYDRWKFKEGGEFSAQQITRAVMSLYKKKHQKRPTLVEAVLFLNKVGIKTVVKKDGEILKVYKGKKLPPHCVVEVEDIEVFFGQESGLIPPPKPDWAA